MGAIKTSFLRRLACRSIVAILTLYTSHTLFAGVEPDQKKKSDSLPLDSSIRYGRLPNGLTYFIKPVSGSGSVIHMKLLQRGGANQRKIEQHEFSHIVEHIAFKPTENFPSGIFNSARLESLGSENFSVKGGSGKSGAVYTFNVLNGNGKGVEAGLSWFGDIASNLDFSPHIVESVRGEVREEFITKTESKLNEYRASSRMFGEIFPCSQQKSLALYETLDAEELKKFYKTWYQPQFLGVAIVGNITDPNKIENQIKSTFSDLKPSNTAIEPEDCNAFYKSTPKFVVGEITKDPNKFVEDPSARIHLFFRTPISEEKVHTKEGLQKLVQIELIRDIVNDRLKGAGNDYLFSQRAGVDFTKRRAGMEIIHSFGNGRGQASISRIVKTLNQLRTYGISKEEFEKFQNKRLKYIRQSFNSQIRYWEQEISEFYLEGKALPAEKNEYISSYLSSLKVNDVNNFISDFLSKVPDDIGIVAPRGHEALSYREEQVRSWINKAFFGPVEPFQKPEIRSLMTPAQIEALSKAEYIQKEIGDSGAREFVFNNGIKLVIKQETSNDPDHPYTIKLHGFSEGGAKFLPEEDYWSAVNASQIIAHSGVNGLDKFDVNRFLSTTNILPGMVVPYIDYSEYGIYGSAELKDLEIMMQLVHLFFTAPNKNVAAFEDWKLQITKSYVASGGLNVRDYGNAWRSVTGNRFLPTTLFRKGTPQGTENYKSLEKTDFDKAFEIYKRFFSDAIGFTFLISGNFEVNQVLPLAQKYLGNLPTSYLHWVGSQGEKGAPAGPSSQMIANQGNYEMQNVSYGAHFLQGAEDPFDWQEHMKVEALGEVLRQKLWDLRFKKGYGFYNATARGNYKPELGRYEIRSYLYCQPQEFSELQKEVKRILSDIKTGRISSSELDPALGRLHYFHFSERALRLGVRIHELYKHYRFGLPWVEQSEAEEFTRNLTVDDIVEVANKYLKKENFHELVIREK